LPVRYPTPRPYSRVQLHSLQSDCTTGDKGSYALTYYHNLRVNSIISSELLSQISSCTIKTDDICLRAAQILLSTIQRNCEPHSRLTRRTVSQYTTNCCNILLSVDRRLQEFLQHKQQQRQNTLNSDILSRRFQLERVRRVP